VEIDDMLCPVRCGRCGAIYDVSRRIVLTRYADYSTWHAPCCGALVDDRPAEGIGRPDIVLIDRPPAPTAEAADAKAALAWSIVEMLRPEAGRDSTP
jgi:hypothetical protein